jgi:hypothetical protein
VLSTSSVTRSGPLSRTASSTRWALSRRSRRGVADTHVASVTFDGVSKVYDNGFKAVDDLDLQTRPSSRPCTPPPARWRSRTWRRSCCSST